MDKRKGMTFGEVVGVTLAVGMTVAMAAPFLGSDAAAIRSRKALDAARRLGGAMLAYTADNAEAMPCGTIPDLSQPADVRYLPAESAIQNPAGWFHEGQMEAEHRLVWNNSVSAYLPQSVDLGVFPSNEIASQPWAGGYLAGGQAPRGVNLTYNGYLQYLSNSDLDGAAAVPMLWQGQGDVTRAGAAMTNPRLNCNGVGPCRFASTKPVQPRHTGDASIFDMMLDSANYTPTSHRNLYVFADGSARSIYFGRGNQLAFPTSVHSPVPFQYLADDGAVTQSLLRGCNLSSGSFVAAFLPSGKDRCTDGADELRGTALRTTESAP